MTTPTAPANERRHIMSNPTGPVDLTGRHPAIGQALRHFEHGHLPEHLQAIARPMYDLAWRMVGEIADDPQLTTGLHDLLRAKDCFVRARLTAGEPTDPNPPAAGCCGPDQNRGTE
jgi:hypothetical protein